VAHFGLMDTEPNRIREHREKEGWSQEELARQAEVSVFLISRLERGLRSVEVKAAQRIAAALKVTVEELFPEEAETVAQ
jgi:transcriptional regulator with XRE-family HTH domain